MYSVLEVIRCSSLSDKITNWPKATRKTEICKYQFYMNEDLYVDIYCMNNHVLIHGTNMGWEKNDLKILNFPCGSL